MVRRSIVVALCVLIVGFGAAQTGEQQVVAAPQASPALTFEITRTHISLSGDVSSVAHESILRQRTTALFPQKTMSFDLHERPALPPAWALISEMALRASIETWSSTIEITDAGIQIRGITSDAVAWKAGLSRIEKNLLPGMHLQHEVTEIRPAASLDRQCRELFRSATRGRTIEFPRAAASLGTAAKPYLDELIQIAVDCPATGMSITGHTDTTGNESVNLALSEARANAVAAYMMDRGIVSERLIIEAAGSSRPLDVGESTQAYQKNRRIEIEMILPSN